jgi:DNA-binding response OmpR family regulator
MSFKATRTILCATDDLESTEIFRRALSDFEVVSATSAFEALRAINSRAFDAYLLDYWLPDWNGCSLCEPIRKLDPHGPIVFCTTANRETERARALRAGANAYLIKPIDPVMLRSRIRTLLTLADSESLRAKFEEECAVQEELDRRLAQVGQRVDRAKQLTVSAVERTARSKALLAFFRAHGTRAHFERWWPNVFSSVRANHFAWHVDDADELR